MKKLFTVLVMLSILIGGMKNIFAQCANTGDTTAVACDSFTWYGTTFYTSDEPTIVLTNMASCDSTVTLHLTINYSTTGDTTAIACNSFIWNGTTYTSTPTVAPTKVLTNSTGCDSTVTLHLTINYSTTGDTTAIACNNFSWNGTIYTSTPTVAPIKVLTNSVGCDSTVTLHLTINYGSTGDTTAVTCNSYTWNGTTYTSTPTVAPIKVLTNSIGCDSTVTLHLTINYGSTSDTTAVACNSYTWNGTVYTSTPTVAPTKVLTNTIGCDSTVTLHLTINYNNSGDTTVVACDSFRWHGTTYTSTPTVAPTHVMPNIAGCDSIVTLNLTIKYSSAGDTTAVVCGLFSWYGTTYPASGDETYTTTNAAGCDSILTLHLTVNPVPATPTITAYSFFIVSNALSGNQWYFNDSAITGATSMYYTATTTGNYYCIVTGTDGCKSDTSNVIYISIAGLTELSDNNNITLYPNPASNDITIESPLQAVIEISNMQGQRIKDFETSGNKINVDVSSFPSGVYVVQMKTEKGMKIRKFVKE